MNKILIIEDSRYTRDLIKRNLDKIGLEDIEEAGTGGEGIELFRRLGPELCILDLKLPDKKGIDVLRQIKESDENIPVIVLTAVGQERKRKKCLELGAEEYITKPFETEKLVQAIKRHL